MYYRIKAISFSAQKNLKWLDVQSFILNTIKIKGCSVKDLESFNLEKIKYFTAVVGGKDQKAKQRQEFYMQALKSINKLEIVTGNFKTVSPKGFLFDSKKNKPLNKKVQIIKEEEKESDVNIGIHMINDCHLYKDLKGIILVTSDTDQTPTLRMIRKEFPKKEIILLRMGKGFSYSLKKLAHLNFVVSKKNLESSQFPSSVRYKGFEIKKPNEWK